MLGISLLWVMVAVAFEKQMTSPDLGCNAFTTEADCMVMMQPFDDKAHACTWDPTLMVPCENAPPDADAQFTPFGMVLLISCMLVVDPFIILIEARSIGTDIDKQTKKPPSSLDLSCWHRAADSTRRRLLLFPSLPFSSRLPSTSTSTSSTRRARKPAARSAHASSSSG